MCGSDVCLGLIAIIFPPFAVWVKKGICSADSVINIALCCLAWLPGLLHAWYIIVNNPDPTYEELRQDPEGGSVTYYYVQSQPVYAQQGRQGGYGTVDSTPNSQFPSHQQGFVQPQPPSQQGGSSEVPPSYAQAVKGDHKVQSS